MTGCSYRRCVGGMRCHAGSSYYLHSRGTWGETKRGRPGGTECSRRYYRMDEEMFHKLWLSVFALGWRSTPTTPAFAPTSSILQQGGTTWSTGYPEHPANR